MDLIEWGNMDDSMDSNDRRLDRPPGGAAPELSLVTDNLRCARCPGPHLCAPGPGTLVPVPVPQKGVPQTSNL